MIWTIFLIVETAALAFDIGVHLVHGRKPTQVIILEDPASRARMMEAHMREHERMLTSEQRIYLAERLSKQ